MESALWPTLADAVSLLAARGLRSALIGGLAVSLRGQPRMTVDVDLVVVATVDETLRLVADLATTPFDPLFPGVEEVVAKAFILPLRHRQTLIRVDLAIGLTGFEQEAVARATPIMIARCPAVTNVLRMNSVRSAIGIHGSEPSAGVGKNSDVISRSFVWPISTINAVTSSSIASRFLARNARNAADAT